MRKGLLATFMALIIAVVIAVTWVPSGPRSTKVFDPDRVADLELEMWRAYYQKEKPKLFSLLVTLLHDQLRFSWSKATNTARHFARAAATFGDVRGEYERVLPDLIRGYELEREWTGAGFDAQRVARAELAWWVARRDGHTSSPANVGRLIGEMYALFYEVPYERVATAGRLRAEAASIRDRTARAPDWDHVALLLHQSYRSLHAACNSQGEKTTLPTVE